MNMIEEIVNNNNIFSLSELSHIVHSHIEEDNEDYIDSVLSVNIDKIIEPKTLLDDYLELCKYYFSNLSEILEGHYGDNWDIQELNVHILQYIAVELNLINSVLPEDYYVQVDDNSGEIDILDYKDLIFKSIEQLVGENVKNYFEHDYYRILIHFPEEVITNSSHAQHTIRDVFISIDMNIFFEKVNRFNDTCYFRLTRTTMSQIEANTHLKGRTFQRMSDSIYYHSHQQIRHYKILDTIIFNNLCLGSNSFANLCYSLNHNLDLENFELFCTILPSFIRWESIEGIPHTRIKSQIMNREEFLNMTLGITSSSQIDTNYYMITPPTSEELSIVSERIFKYISENPYKISFTYIEEYGIYSICDTNINHEVYKEIIDVIPKRFIGILNKVTDRFEYNEEQNGPITSPDLITKDHIESNLGKLTDCSITYNKQFQEYNTGLPFRNKLIKRKIVPAFTEEEIEKYVEKYAIEYDEIEEEKEEKDNSIDLDNIQIHSHLTEVIERKLRLRLDNLINNKQKNYEQVQ